jgi:uncharacterized peroxidase-related enzyme
MMRFQQYTPLTAPLGAQDLLRRVKSGFGFLPSLFAGLAESPGALAAYLDLRAHFEKCSLSAIEQQVVALVVSVENRSVFCVSAHSHAARHLAGMPDDVLQALRDGRPLPDPRLDVLAQFTRELVREGGRVDDGDLNVFLAAGYTMPQVLDVILGVALKTFTNCASHVVRPVLNEEFEAERWTPPSGVQPLGEAAEAVDEAEVVTQRNDVRH